MGKKRAPADPSKILPVEISSEVLPNGDLYFDVRTYFSFVNFTATYSNEFVDHLLAGQILSLYKKIASGESLKDTPFEKLTIRLHPDQEKKDVDEAWNTLLYFFSRASRIYEHALPVKLAHFSEQLMTEVLISVMLDMEEGEVVVIEGGRIDIWDFYLDELKKVLKKSWNKTISRGAKYWNPAKRAALLKLYEAAFEKLRDWWQKHHKSRTSPSPSGDDWKRAEASNPRLVPFLKKLSHSKPYELALEYVSQELGVRGEQGLRKQLTLARREAADRKK